MPTANVESAMDPVQPTEHLPTLFVATNKHVAALDPATGIELWRTKLPNAGAIVSLLVTPDLVFAGSQGQVYALNLVDGRILWQNSLQGLGYHPIILGSLGNIGDPGALAATLAAAQAAAAAAAAAAAG